MAALGLSGLALAADPGPQKADSHDSNAAQSDGAPQRTSPLVTIINPPAAPLQSAANQGPQPHDEPHKPFWLQWEFWTAFGTLGLGAVTLLLVGKTDGLIRSAERSSERQLRAYLSAAQMFLIEQDQTGTKFEVRVMLKNFGQTPAYAVVFSGILQLIPANVVPNFDFNVAKPGNPGNAVIGPTQDKSYSCVLGGTLTNLEILDLLNPNHNDTLVVWGTAWYKDAFGRGRHTNFCRAVVWHVPGEQPLWMDLPGHNDAD